MTTLPCKLCFHPLPPSRHCTQHLHIWSCMIWQFCTSAPLADFRYCPSFAGHYCLSGRASPSSLAVHRRARYRRPARTSPTKTLPESYHLPSAIAICVSTRLQGTLPCPLDLRIPPWFGLISHSTSRPGLKRKSRVPVPTQASCRLHPPQKPHRIHQRSLSLDPHAGV